MPIKECSHKWHHSSSDHTKWCRFITWIEFLHAITTGTLFSNRPGTQKRWIGQWLHAHKRAPNLSVTVWRATQEGDVTGTPRVPGPRSGGIYTSGAPSLLAFSLSTHTEPNNNFNSPTASAEFLRWIRRLDKTRIIQFNADCYGQRINSWASNHLPSKYPSRRPFHRGNSRQTLLTRNSLSTCQSKVPPVLRYPVTWFLTDVTLARNRLDQLMKREYRSKRWCSFVRANMHKNAKRGVILCAAN